MAAEARVPFLLLVEKWPQVGPSIMGPQPPLKPAFYPTLWSFQTISTVLPSRIGDSVIPSLLQNDP